MILRSFDVFIFEGPYSISVACGVFFGHNVGAAKPAVAMQYYKFNLIAGMLFAVIQATSFYIG